MNWDAVAAIGQIIGALAVVATLFYLAVQIRQNSQIVEEHSRQIRLGEVDATVQSFSRYRALLAQSHMADIYSRGRHNLEQLTETEKIQMSALLDEYIFSYWALYHRLQQNAYDESDWEAHLPVLSNMLSQPGVATWWDQRKTSFPPHFVASIATHVEAVTPAPASLAPVDGS